MEGGELRATRRSEVFRDFGNVRWYQLIQMLADSYLYQVIAVEIPKLTVHYVSGFRKIIDL